MNLASKIFVLGIIAFIITDCSPSLRTSNAEDYYEDLTLLRPVYSVSEKQVDPEVELLQESTENNNVSGPFNPQFDITHKLDSLLDTIAANNRQIKFVQGYTIQVYTGNSQEEANDAKAKVYQALPGSRPTVTYDLPNYKVKVGKYYYRLHAQKEFAIVKKVFSSAILAPQQFRID